MDNIYFEYRMTELMDVDRNITADIFTIYFLDQTGATRVIHIYDITDSAELIKIVSAYVNIELGDGEHDLQRTIDQKNPLILYCERHKTNGRSYINEIFVDFSYDYLGDCTSQTAIKKK